MALWNSLLRADSDCDLSTRDAAVEWWRKNWNGEQVAWKQKHLSLWRECLDAFRSVASRLMKNQAQDGT